jgi:hypothetical protein
MCEISVNSFFGFPMIPLTIEFHPTHFSREKYGFKILAATANGQTPKFF